MNNPEILKCPCCGDLPKIYPWGGGYLCHCERYACDFYYSISAYDETSVIEGWNEAVLRYKESKNEQTNPEEKDDTKKERI